MRPHLRRAFYHLHLILLHVGSGYALLNFEWPWVLGALCVYLFLQLFGGNIALHRYFSHQSFNTGNTLDKLLIVVGNLTCLGSSISWVSTHLHHHRYADQESDCHSPHHLGVHKILLGYWNPAKDTSRAVRQLKNFSWHLFFHRWYYPLHFTFAAALFLLDWRIFAFLYALPNLLVYYALYSVVIICHSIGYRNYPTTDQSRNNRLVATLTLGEGWHNNHHNDPNNYRNTVHSQEWDPTARIIEWCFKKKS